MKKKIFLITFFLLSISTYSQDNIYVIVDKLKSGKTMNVYEVNEQIITSQTYENREIDNPEYLEILKEVSRLEAEISLLKGGELNESERKSLLFTRQNLKKSVSENSKKYLKSASEEISKTKFKILKRK